MAENLSGAAEQPAATIRDQLAAAFEEAEAANTETVDTGETAGAAKGEEAAPAEGAETAAARDEKGRFAKRAGETAKEPIDPAAAKAGAEKPEGAAAGEADPAKVAAAPGEVPQHWSAEDKALIAKLPPEHQAAVVERFKKIEAGFTPKLQRASELEKTWGEVEKLAQPHSAALQAQGWTVPTLFKAWMGVEAELAGGPERAAKQIAAIAKAYNVDLGKLTGGAPAAAAPQRPAGEAQAATGEIDLSQVDPALKPILEPLLAQITALKGELSQVKTTQTGWVESAQNAAIGRTHADIQAFADAKGEDGTPSHPHFAEVMTDMLEMARAATAAGRTPTLKELYDKAVWINPVTREKQTAAIAAQAKADAEKAQRDAAAAEKERAARARKTGSSVTGAPSGGGQAAASSPKGSLRDQISAAFDEHA